MSKRNNKLLLSAKKAKNDEFYTRLEDIEEELRYYIKHFKNKVVYCNCDDPEWSNFYKYFKINFDALRLKKLISTHFERENKASYAIIKETGKEYKIALKGNGDFRTEECIEFLKQADIVVTNPPFSLFREYVAQLMKYKKKFLIIGNISAVSYKEIFPLIKNNEIWLGTSVSSGNMEFRVPDHYPLKSSSSRMDNKGNKYVCVNARWFTNLSYKKRKEIILWNTYDPEKMLKYDNYDAININKTAEIPKNYDDVMGVPITFFDKYNPAQFEIVGIARPKIGKRNFYARILIKKKKK